MKLENIKVIVATEEQARTVLNNFVSLGYRVACDADHVISRYIEEGQEVVFYGEKNRYPSMQAGEYVVEYDLVGDDSESEHTLLTIKQLEGLAMGDKLENAEPQTITILWSEYKDLQRAARELQALENHGVDNWHGYGEAMKEAYQDEDEDD